MSAALSGDFSVLVLNNYCSAQGGASRVAIDEAVGLANRGVAVTFLGAIGPVCDELARAPLAVRCLGQTDLANAQGRIEVVLQGLWNTAAASELDTLLREFDPRRTIVHLHGFSQALSSSPVRCAIRRGFEVVYTLHDFFAACPNGAFFDYVAGTPCTRRALSLDCIATNCDKRRYADKLYRTLRSVVQRQFGGLPREVGNYIALSRRSAEVMHPYLPAAAHIYSVRNPVHVVRAPAIDVARNRRVVAVGRLDPEKGIAALVRAAELTATPLTLIGDGPLQRLAEAAPSCRVTGWLTREGVLAELEQARCLVFPSLWYETYGLAVDEAAARGIPAIVSDISAAAERVADQVSGWHTRAGDVAQLARCLNLLADDALVASAGQQAYARFWSDPPTLDKHVDELMAAYQDILRRRFA